MKRICFAEDTVAAGMDDGACAVARGETISERRDFYILESLSVAYDPYRQDAGRS